MKARPTQGLLPLAAVGKHFPEVLQPPVVGGGETGLLDVTGENIKGPSSCGGEFDNI